MGKRKSSDKEYDHIMKKMKKLKKKLKRTRRGYESSSSSDSVRSVVSPSNIEDGPLAESETMNVDDGIEIVDMSTANAAHNTAPCLGPITEPTPVASTSTAPQPSSLLAECAEQTMQEPEVDKILLDLLGDDPTVNKKCGKEINPDLALRLQHFVTSGLSQDTRKELHTKYLIPVNCTLIDAPTLNPEIKAAISETVLKRDKGIELKQRQLGSAIACISEAVSTLLNSENRNTEIIKLLMDASRLLCDTHNNDSLTRRNFVLYNLKKDMRDHLQKSKIDTYLFGSDLAETLKTAKFISKSGAELKSAPPSKPPVSKQTPAIMPQRSNLNWKAPPQNRRPQGNQETKQPAQRSQHASFSRPSRRGPPPKSRKRQ